MSKFLTVSASTALLSGLILITGCSSSDDSSSTGTTGTTGTTATVPANAILIDTSLKAETTTRSAAGTGIAVASVFGVETTTILTPRDIINILLEKVHSNTQKSASIVTGADLSANYCPGGGTAIGDQTETPTTLVANITFNNCIDGIVTITGNISINATFSSNSTGPYSDNISGDLTAVLGSSSFGFNGFRFIQSGDDSTGAYTITTFTFAINPSAGGGYLVQLNQALVGNEFVSCELTSGQILVTGATGSQARATINPDGSAKIEYHSGDGTFVETDTSPFTCLI